MYCAERRREEADRTIKLLVDPARLRKLLGEHYSLEQVWVLLGELCGAVIEIESPHLSTTERIMGPVLAVAKYSRTETRADPFAGRVRRKNPPRSADRRMLTVRLGEAWTTLIRLDLPLHYNPSRIARLQYGVSQAVARHILTHRGVPNGGWTVDRLIATVAGDIHGQALRDARRWLHKDALGLAEIGIVVAGDRVSVGTPPNDATLVGHPPGGVGHPPGGVGHPPGGVGHPPGETAALQDL